MSTRFLLSLLVCFSFATGVGCKSLDINGDDSSVSKDKENPWWKKDDLPPVEQASKIVAIWSNSVLNESGALPIRGLGGRVYFYDSKHQPVRVDGKFTVFLYDDTKKTTDETQEATRKIHFSPEEVAEKYTPTEFGPSYSFWVPWDVVGGERVQLSVIPVFTSKDGEALVGKQARYLLPGTKPTEIAEEVPRQGVVPASYEDGGDENGTKLRLRSSTIKVPPAVQRRLRTPHTATKTNASESVRKQIPAQSQTASPKPRVSDLPRNSFSRSRTSRKGFDRYERKSTEFPSLHESNATQTKTSRAADLMNAGAEEKTTVSTQPTADFQPDPRQVQDLRSLQQASVRDQNVLDRAKRLFARSQ